MYSDHGFSDQDLSRGHPSPARTNGFYDAYYAHPNDQTQASLNFYTVPETPHPEFQPGTPTPPSPPLRRCRRRDGVLFENGLPIYQSDYRSEVPSPHSERVRDSTVADLYADSYRYHHSTASSLSSSEVYGEYEPSKTLGRQALDYHGEADPQSHEYRTSPYGSFDHEGVRSLSFDQRDSYSSAQSCYTSSSQPETYQPSQISDSYASSIHESFGADSYYAYDDRQTYVQAEENYGPLYHTHPQDSQSQMYDYGHYR